MYAFRLALKVVFLAAGLLSWALLPAAAQSLRWDGDGQTSEWENPSNWGGDHVPRLGDAVVYWRFQNRGEIATPAGRIQFEGPVTFSSPEARAGISSSSSSPRPRQQR